MGLGIRDRIGFDYADAGEDDFMRLIDALEWAALRTRERAAVSLDDREREFLIDMLDSAGIVDHADLDLDGLRALYEEHYDDIWCNPDSDLSHDNARHEDDDYHSGYQAGAAMVLRLLNEEFGIGPALAEEAVA